MCGIAGLLNLDRDAPADAALVRRMMRRLVHRGPDGEGLFVAGPVALGHRRLAIIDSAGRRAADGQRGRHRSQLVFNGEIYNYRELRADAASRAATLPHATATPRSSSICTRRRATTACTRLRGMFAFALWDARAPAAAPGARPRRDQAALLPRAPAAFAVRAPRSRRCWRTRRSTAGGPAGDRPLPRPLLRSRRERASGWRAQAARRAHVLSVENGRIDTRVVLGSAAADAARVAVVRGRGATGDRAAGRQGARAPVSDVPVGVVAERRRRFERRAALRFARQRPNRCTDFTVGFDGGDVARRASLRAPGGSRFGTRAPRDQLRRGRFPVAAAALCVAHGGAGVRAAGDRALVVASLARRRRRRCCSPARAATRPSAATRSTATCSRSKA